MPQANAFRVLWDRLRRLPAGPALFNRTIAIKIPYTGSIRARVEQLHHGYARVSMKDRRALRNHLGSVHAIALANLAEYTGNLALAYSLPDDARFIVTKLEVEYTKKARGTITGECHAPPVPNNERCGYPLNVTLKDSSGEVVATAILQSLVGPTKRSA